MNQLRDDWLDTMSDVTLNKDFRLHSAKSNCNRMDELNCLDFMGKLICKYRDEFHGDTNLQTKG